jgi:uncharacterized protein YceH (UPF0502 family)
MALVLTPVEARVIASLVEKSLTTPQYYPMSVNSLMAACNQKNSRDPVMSLSEGEVGAALNRLEELRLAKRDDQGSRVPKWRHRFNHEMLLKDAGQAVLVTLMLRGPQTPAELRANAAALHGPADLAGVQATLDDLADRAQPLAVMLPRLPGQSAQRHAHLLCGAPVIPEASASESAARVSGATLAQLLERIEALEARVQALEGGKPS